MTKGVEGSDGRGRGMLLFHPSTAVFVQQVARSLWERGLLDRFVTALRYDVGNRAHRAMAKVASLARRGLETTVRRREVSEVPRGKVRSLPWGEVARLLVGRVDRTGCATDSVWEVAERSFDRRVAGTLRRGLGGVYGYEHASLATFRRARSLGLPVVYDVPAADSSFVRRLLEAEMERFPELRTAYQRHTTLREGRRLARRRAEWRVADRILVNSRFTRDTYADSGMDCSKVRVAPLGAPPPVPRSEALRPPQNPSVHFVWAGTFGVLKGAHLLLDAWRAGALGARARLSVYGSVRLPDRVLRPLPAGIEFKGPVPRSMLLDRLSTADALVLPTLCDGFGMVVTEAWSRGVPVISTERAGACERLQPGVNGWTVKAGDAGDLRERLDRCVSHSHELRAMREGAWDTASSWQWEHYRRLHGDLVADVIEPDYP